MFAERYVQDADRQGWSVVEVDKPHKDYIVRNEYAESRRTAEEYGKKVARSEKERKDSASEWV